MPNTLAHLGIQTLITRAVIRRADVKWIWAGCVLPDLPWILQRAGRALVPDLSPYDLRLYAIAQSTLLLCLVLSAALACFADQPRRVFTILGLGSVMHLLLDALQTKWANGVHLFAPFSWELLNFGLFWPEDAPTWILTGLGLAMALYAFIRPPDRAGDLVRPRGGRLAAFAILAALYLGGPVALMAGPLAADNHFVATLQAIEDRPGRGVAFDRNRLLRNGEAAELIAWTGEHFAVSGTLPETDIMASVRGRFQDHRTVEIAAFHEHSSGLRDLASYLGLGLVLAWWGCCRSWRVHNR